MVCSFGGVREVTNCLGSTAGQGSSPDTCACWMACFPKEQRAMSAFWDADIQLLHAAIGSLSADWRSAATSSVTSGHHH